MVLFYVFETSNNIFCYILVFLNTFFMYEITMQFLSPNLHEIGSMSAVVFSFRHAILT